MDKKLIIGVLVAIAIIILILLGFKSCNPRTKTITSETQEYSAFINANIEYVCALSKDPTLAANNEASQKKLNEMFAKYYLPASDNEQMFDLMKKYENDAEVISIVQQNSANCLQGGSPIFYQAAAK
jgi:hypothetical protein